MDEGNGNEDELYDYSTKGNTNQAYDNADYWNIPAQSVVLGRRLPGANGRFADIHEATWKGKTVVAKKVKGKPTASLRNAELYSVNIQFKSL